MALGVIAIPDLVPELSATNPLVVPTFFRNRHAPLTKPPLSPLYVDEGQPAPELRALGAKGMLEPATIDAVTGLRMMRNMAAHAPEPISDDKARDFVAMANAVVFAISMNLKKRDRS